MLLHVRRSHTITSKNLILLNNQSSSLTYYDAQMCVRQKEENKNVYTYIHTHTEKIMFTVKNHIK